MTVYLRLKKGHCVQDERRDSPITTDMLLNAFRQQLFSAPAHAPERLATGLGQQPLVFEGKAAPALSCLAAVPARRETMLNPSWLPRASIQA